MLMRGEICANCNHWKSNILVRFCSMCGEVVNEKIPMKRCPEEEHGIKKRQRNKYCVDCGQQLMNG